MERFPAHFVSDRIKFENSWWENPDIDNYYSKMQKRSFFELFFRKLMNEKDDRNILLVGSKRVGKTVIIHQAIQELINSGFEAKNIVYISLENPIYYSYRLDELVNLVLDTKNNPKQKFYFFLDKIQYHNNWTQEIVELCKAFPHIKFVFSDSVYQYQAKNIVDIEKYFIRFRLPTLTFFEYVNFNHPEEFFDCDEDSDNCNLHLLDDAFADYLKYGGHPELVLSKTPSDEAARLFRNRILNRFTLKAFPSLSGINSLQELNAFIAYIVLNTGKELSVNEIAKLTDLNEETVNLYLEFLKNIFFIKILKPYGNSNSDYFKIYIANPSFIYAMFDFDTVVKYLDYNQIVETAILSQWEFLESDFFYYSQLKNINPIVKISNDEIRWCTSVLYSNENLKELDGFAEFCAKHEMFFPVFATKSLFDTFEYGDLMISRQPSSLYAYQVGRHIIETELNKL